MTGQCGGVVATTDLPFNSSWALHFPGEKPTTSPRRGYHCQGCLPISETLHQSAGVRPKPGADRIRRLRIRSLSPARSAVKTRALSIFDNPTGRITLGTRRGDSSTRLIALPRVTMLARSRGYAIHVDTYDPRQPRFGRCLMQSK